MPIRDKKWWMIYSAMVAAVTSKRWCDGYLSEGILARIVEQTDMAWKHATPLPAREPKQDLARKLAEHPEQELHSHPDESDDWMAWGEE